MKGFNKHKFSEPEKRLLMPSIKKYIRDGRAPIPVNEAISEIMSSIKDRNTKPELILRKALWNNGVRGYRLHWKKVPGRPDIAFPGKKIAVFVNGCFWHRCPHCDPPMPKSNTNFWSKKLHDNKERDQRKLDQLNEAGWSLLIIWECQLESNCMVYVEKIKRNLNKNKS